MINVRNGDLISCIHNNKTVIGKLVCVNSERAAVYITDETGSYQIDVLRDTLRYPITGECVYTIPDDLLQLCERVPLGVAKEEEISKPKRYNKVGTLECWDVILDQKMDFLEGSILKYVWRHKEKNGKHDLKKAKEYLEKMIADYDKLYEKES
jgi:hypothetical protein